MKNLKKVVSSVAALAIVASSVSAFAIKFPDVDSSASYANAVDTLVALGIVKGDDQGKFNPDNSVTRAEFTKMAVGALGELASAEAQTTSKFADAANTGVHWAAGYIAQGVADGFINGYDENTFGPNDSVTYNQACKMLVAAVGYEKYAQNAGGWPTGYTSQASSLGISKGVSPSAEDAALTRAQCAVMIYNALQVPLNVIDGWDTNVLGDSTPIYKKLDGKEKRDYQTLLTDRHDAYVVKGRVSETYQGSAGSLKKGEVKYDVEVSDNFDDELDIKATDDTKKRETFKVGDTDAANMLFAYTEAIVQKDEDTDEYTLLSIVNYGNAKIVEFAAADLDDDDDAIRTDDKTDVAYIEKHKLAVLKGSNTSATTKYDLDEKAEIYVNGVRVGVATTSDIKKYILANPTGTVQIVDMTKTASTSTDGKYDRIMVTFYVDAVVDYVTTTSAYARIYFKNSQINAMSMQWDPEDEDKEVKFVTVDGTEVNYEDLEENDVLSILYDMEQYKTGSNALNDNDFYKVIVSKNVVEGNLTSKDPDDHTVTVNGTEYDLVYNDGKYSTDTQSMANDSDFELGTEYKLYIDAFGYVAHKEDGSSDKNYGVIVAMYTGSGDDQPSVRMITSDGKVVAYECKDKDETKKFYNYALSRNENGTASYTDFKKLDEPFKSNILAGATVCTYTLSGGKIKFKQAYPKSGSPAGGAKLEYKANSQKIGSYSINDTATKIIDMDDYMNGSDTTVKTLSVSSFEDEAEYTAYFYDKNSESVYRFAIVFKGTSSIRAESQLAVIKKFNGQSDTDGKTCSTYTVLRAGEEVEVLVEYINEAQTPKLEEGSVIAYTLNSDGYVDYSKDLYVLYAPDSTYEATRANILNNQLFGQSLNYVLPVTTDPTDRKYGKYEIEFKPGEKSTTKDVYAYVGIVYKKSGNNLELFIKKDSSNVSNITTPSGMATSDVADLSLAGANVYLYDYNYQANKGARVSIGTATQSDSVFNSTYFDTENKTSVSWSKVETEDKKPLLAFVKEVDGDVTDCLLIQAK